MAQKEVIYIDVEDDITTIIDKATKGDGNIVALVLPKKTPTLKSSVNMKLLKNSLDKAHKKTVLITKEAALLPLAGAAAMHVADDLKSRPSIPASPKAKPADPVLAVKESQTDKPTDNESSSQATEEDTNDKDPKNKTTKNSKIRIPNFDKFRIKVILGVLAVILLAVGWFVMFKVMPKASVVIQAQTSRLATNVEFILDPTLATSQPDENIIKGQVQEIKKTVTERFDATGEKDVGQKASGIVTVQNCDSSDDFTLPAGTLFTDSVTGFVFVSSSAVAVPGGSFSGGGCSAPGEADVSVIAREGGDNKNLSPRAYSIAGVSSLVTGFGGQMSGGTSEKVKVVSEVDISNAKQTLLNKTDENIKSEIAGLFDDQTLIIEETFAISNTEPVSSVEAGTEATEASVSAEFTYSAIGVSKVELTELIEKDQLSQIDAGSLSIIDNGVDQVNLELVSREGNQYVIEASTDGYVGPEIDVAALSQEISGQKYSQVLEIIRAKPGVQDAEVELSPFWVFSAPSSEKITITVEVSDSPALQN